MRALLTLGAAMLLGCSTPAGSSSEGSGTGGAADGTDQAGTGDASTGDTDDGGDTATADGADAEPTDTTTDGNDDTGVADTGTDEADTGTDEADTGTDEADTGTDESDTGTDESDTGTDESDTGTDGVDGDCHCASDDECGGADWFCLDPGPLGECLEVPEPGMCWSDDDCGDFESCLGAAICPCDVVCVAHQPGFCEGPAPACCGSDLDCAIGEVCTVDGAETGTCKPMPAADVCWKDGDCKPNQICIAATACPCGIDCDAEDVAGHCESKPVDGACCTDDSDCGPTQDCINPGFGGIQGVCKPAKPLVLGNCWEDEDCKEGQTCEGENICPCGAACFVADAPGKCQGGDVAPPGSCCASDADCADGTYCAESIPSSDGQWGSCMWKPPVGKCWEDEDCEGDDTCIGAFDCGCDVACGAPSIPGACGTDLCDGVALPPKGCSSAAQCQPGQACVMNGSCNPSSCGCDPATGSILCTADCQPGFCAFQS